MADRRPNFPAFSKPADEALSNLYSFKEQNPLRTSADFMYSPSSSPSPAPAYSNVTGSPASTISVTPSPSPTVRNFDSTRMAIPTHVYAPGYPHIKSEPSPTYSPPYRPESPYTPPGHMPVIAPPTPPMVVAQTPDCITFESLLNRVQELLRENLALWWSVNHEALHRISKHQTDHIITYGVRGTFGPHGLGKLTDIFMSIGHEGTAHYVCLAASSHCGDVTVLLRGAACELEGAHPLQDEEAMDAVRLTFDAAAGRLYRSIIDMSAGGVRPGGFGL